MITKTSFNSLCALFNEYSKECPIEIDGVTYKLLPNIRFFMQLEINYEKHYNIRKDPMKIMADEFDMSTFLHVVHNLLPEHLAKQKNALIQNYKNEREERVKNKKKNKKKLSKKDLEEISIADNIARERLNSQLAKVEYDLFSDAFKLLSKTIKINTLFIIIYSMLANQDGSKPTELTWDKFLNADVAVFAQIDFKKMIELFIDSMEIATEDDKKKQK